MGMEHLRKLNLGQYLQDASDIVKFYPNNTKKLFIDGDSDRIPPRQVLKSKIQTYNVKDEYLRNSDFVEF